MDTLLSALTAILIGLQIIVMVVDIFGRHRDNNQRDDKPPEKEPSPTEEE